MSQKQGSWALAGCLAIAVLALAGLRAAPAPAAAAFDELFVNKTMRVDYFHSGTAAEEHVSLDRIVSDGPWAGSRTRLLDDTNLGKYLFEVRDAQSNGILYSRGFASVYGEWETTSEAKKVWRTYHESLRFPWPKRAVQVALRKRDSEGVFRELWTAAIDPNSRFVNTTDALPRGAPWTIFESGPPAGKVDVVLLPEGYTAGEKEKFHRDAKRLTEALFLYEPFKSRRSDFNFRAVDLASPESGISRPHAGIFRRTPLSAHFSSFDSERYVLTFDNRALREAAASVPYEFLVILVNERTYGGGGIFGDQTTAAAGNAFAVYLFVHEFGHHFAALGDEYYTSDVAYETGAAEKPEPWEPNLTAMHDPKTLKWRDLVEPGTPLPTPWEKEAFEKMNREAQAERRRIRATGAPEEEMEKLFRKQQAEETRLLSGMKYSGKVGAFEGAGYEVKGLYRAEADCIMFSRNEVGFCRVCRRGIERVIDLYTKP